MSSPYQSVNEKIKYLHDTFPDRILFRFSNLKGEITETFTCKEIYSRAREIAFSLIHIHDLKPGDHVLLVYPPGLAFVESFLACLLAGIIPVPVPPPQPLRPEIGLHGYTAIASSSNAVAQLTSNAYSKSRTFGRILQALKFGPKWPDLPWIITDTIKAENPFQFDPICPNAGEVAYLQYTSGSTREPRGVSITFGNLWAQTALLKNDNHMEWDRSSVFWMPHYHDFALVGGIICAFCGNYDTVLFAAESFIRRPALWGELLTRYHASHTGAPDFGYRLFTLKTTQEERAQYDFSQLEVMMTAAEPIRPTTIDQMLIAFRDSKLKTQTICPSYGLAEHTVAVALNGKKRFFLDRESISQIGNSIKALNQNEPGTIELFGCGPPCQGVELRIVNPSNKEALGPGTVGEIWVDSPSKAKDYFGRPEESKLKFEASLHHSDRKWLRTGDLGAVIENELVILGRIDDVILFRGKNIFPQDIEGLISENESRVRTGRVLAFGVPEDDLIFIIVETKDKSPSPQMLNELSISIRGLLQQEIGIAQAILIYAPHGTIPKTTSGKLQRNKCKTDWLAGKLPSIKMDRGMVESGS